jgi:hypothetical protein
MKKTIMMLAVALLVAGLLVSAGCKDRERFDITGIWDFYVTLDVEEFIWTYSFIGNRNSGVVLYDGQELGTYSVINDSISFTLEYYDQDDDYVVEVYNGYFDAWDQMSGTISYTIGGLGTITGTWVAYR